MKSWMFTLLIMWFASVPVGVATIFLIAGLISKNEKIALTDRRKLYTKLLTRGVYILLGCHSIFVFATLPTHVFDPLSQLWFHETFARLAIPIVPLFAFVPLALLPLINKKEKKLMAPTEEEAGMMSPPPVVVRPVVETPKKKNWLYVRLAIIAVAFAVMLYSDGLDKNSSLREPLRIFSFMAIPLSFMLGLSAFKFPKYKVEATEETVLEEQLKGIVARIASRMDIAPPQSKILKETFYGTYGGSSSIKGVAVSVSALENLPPEELDALVARELAHYKLKHRLKSGLFALCPMLLIFPLIYTLFGSHSHANNPLLFRMLPVLPVLLVMPLLVYSKTFNANQNYAADKLAVETTGNYTAAIKLLNAMTRSSLQPGVVNPLIQKRIDRLNELARQNGPSHSRG